MISMSNLFKIEIQRKIAESMKSGNKIALETYRSISTAIQKFESGEKTIGKPLDMVEIITPLVKQRKQSIEIYETNNQKELADQEKAELAILETFLPKSMTEAEITEKIDAIITNLGVITKNDMGKIINLFKAECPGQDMKIVSTVVKAKLPV